MKRILCSVLLVVCLLSVASPIQAAEYDSVSALDANPYAVIASWWGGLVSLFGLGIGDLSFSAVASSSEPSSTTMGGSCLDPNGGVVYIVPCPYDNPTAKR